MKWASVLVGIAAVLFAFNGIVSKVVLTAGIGPYGLTAMRSSVAFLVFLVIKLASKKCVTVPNIKDLPALAIYSASGFLVVPITYLYSIERLPVGIALLIEYVAPVFVAVWAALIDRRNSRRGVWVGLIFCIIGLSLAVRVWEDLAFNPSGIAYALIAAIALATSYISGSRIVATQGSVNANIYAFGFSAIVTTAAQPWHGLRIDVFTRQAHGLPVWLLCIDIIILGTVLPYLMLLEGLRRSTATITSVISTLEPIAAVFFAWLLLNQRLGALQITGASILMLGILTAIAGSPAPRSAMVAEI
jgi:drug/metabolite transporter (DMT)-like permease